MVITYNIYGFIHAHEQVYFPLINLIWKDEDLYASVIPILGGFHQVSVIQKILYKRHQCMGYEDWFVDSEIIAPGSGDQSFEGRHYFRSMRLHKEVFAAIVQTKAESLAINIVPLLLSKVSNDRKVFEGCVNNAGYCICSKRRWFEERFFS